MVNKNVTPFEPRSPIDPSGIRIGMPTVTSRGMGEKEMSCIADFIDRVLSDKAGDTDGIKQDVKNLCDRFPIYKGLLEDVAGAPSS